MAVAKVIKAGEGAFATVTRVSQHCAAKLGMAKKKDGAQQKFATPGGDIRIVSS